MKQMYAEHGQNEETKAKFLRSLFKPQKSEAGTGMRYKKGKKVKKATLAPAPKHIRLTISGKKVVLRDFWYVLSLYKNDKII
jgi:hypothetical protein